MINQNENNLKHYGVKGMRWGRLHSRQNTSNERDPNEQMTLSDLPKLVSGIQSQLPTDLTDEEQFLVISMQLAQLVESGDIPLGFLQQFQKGRNGFTVKTESEEVKQARLKKYSNYKVAHNDDSNSLSHFGVLGMKWGVRNDDEPKGRKTSGGKSTNAFGKVARIVNKMISGYKSIKRWSAEHPTLTKSLVFGAALANLLRSQWNQPVGYRITRPAPNIYARKGLPMWSPNSSNINGKMAAFEKIYDMNINEYKFN